MTNRCIIHWIPISLGQTTQSPEAFCSENNLTMRISSSSSPHSAWQPLSNCSLSSCRQNSSRNAGDCRLSSMPCFDYRTANSTSYCAPGSLCSLLEACNNVTGGCSSSTSVCVVNSCCSPQAVCLPMMMINLCSTQISTSRNAHIHSFHVPYVISHSENFTS